MGLFICNRAIWLLHLLRRSNKMRTFWKKKPNPLIINPTYRIFIAAKIIKKLVSMMNFFSYKNLSSIQRNRSTADESNTPSGINKNRKSCCKSPEIEENSGRSQNTFETNELQFLPMNQRCCQVKAKNKEKWNKQCYSTMWWLICNLLIYFNCIFIWLF